MRLAFTDATNLQPKQPLAILQLKKKPKKHKCAPADEIKQQMEAHFRLNPPGSTHSFPTQVQFYRIGRTLGRGAFGKVSLALHRLTAQLVAVKSVKKGSQIQEQRCLQEMQLITQCRDRNIMQVYDYFETPKHTCFVVELCAAGDLFSYIKKRRRLTEPQAKYFFRQILLGLNAMHQASILHRDIKLENLMLTAVGEVKIGDFGVSRKMTKRCFEQCGTPAYIAPELLTGQGYEGFKADLWSAGVCLYAMIVGSVPFKAQSIPELHELIKAAKYDFKYQAGSIKKEDNKNGKSIFSPEVKDLIAKLLTVDPLQRLSAAEALKHPWLSDCPAVMNLFTDKEQQIIQSDYRRLCNLPGGADDVEESNSMMLTEHPLDTMKNEDLP